MDRPKFRHVLISIMCIAFKIYKYVMVPSAVAYVENGSILEIKTTSL